VLCCLFWFLYYKLILQEFCSSSKYCSFANLGLVGNFDVFVHVFCVQLLGSWTQTGPSPWSLEVLKKHKRKAPSLITRPPLFCCFSFLFSYFLSLLFPFISPSFCLFLLVPCRYSNDSGSMSHLRHRQELEILFVWPLTPVCKEK